MESVRKNNDKKVIALQIETYWIGRFDHNGLFLMK